MAPGVVSSDQPTRAVTSSGLLLMVNNQYEYDSHFQHCLTGSCIQVRRDCTQMQASHTSSEPRHYLLYRYNVHRTVRQLKGFS